MYTENSIDAVRNADVVQVISHYEDLKKQVHYSNALLHLLKTERQALKLNLQLTGGPVTQPIKVAMLLLL